MHTSYSKKISDIILISFFIIHIPVIIAQDNLGFINANIFNGEIFIKQDIYAIDGELTFSKPAKLDSIIDLDGKYLIPPFGDSHTHNLDRDWQMSFLPNQYLNEGTFYVLNLTSKLDGVKKNIPYFKKKHTIDVRFSHQGLTSTLGHPFMAYEPFTMNIPYSEWEKNMNKIRVSRLDENNSYVFLDNKKEVKKRLDLFFKEKPDVVKIFLVNSQDYKKNFRNNIIADNGLSISIAKEIVKQSHKRKLLIYAHIESPYDFKKGIRIGVDNFAHMPGYGWNGDSKEYAQNYTDTKTLKLAVKNNVGIVPTIGQSLLKISNDSLKKVAFVKDFLLRYHKLGGKIYTGSDIFNKTLADELNHFINLNIFDNLTLLNIFCETTPRGIFPNRKIGLLKETYEASFLVLDDNPLIDIQAIKKISLKVKQGIIVK